jgi:16S rRNA (guanine966-N2)-methyltransferase
MRVIAGTYGGRRLQTAPGPATRPTSDRVREALFSILGERVRGARVLDLFAGSGALGIEALSRGASAVTFVDDDARALATVRRNLAATGLAAGATVVRADALRFDGGPFELALLDPPYAFDDEAWQALLMTLDADVAVLESDRELPLPEPWRLLRAKRYGGTVVMIVRRT